MVRDELFVFWGVNNPSLWLAKNIRSCRRNYRIAFVVKRNPRGADIARLKSLNPDNVIDCDIDTLAKALRYSDADDLAETAESLFFGKAPQYKEFRQLIDNSTKVHIFFFGENEEENMRNMELIKQAYDKWGKEREEAVSKNEVHIYCGAARSDGNRWAEIYEICNYNCASRLHLHIVDSSRLSILALKKNVNYHPAAYVKVDPETATVASAFRSMIVGFGVTGREALAFLYEFGAFVGSNGKKTPFHCTVVDAEMDEIEGLFLTKCPALKNSEEFSFLKMAVNTREYLERVDTEISDGLNYAVVALGDDLLSLSVAEHLVRRAAQLRSQIADCGIDTNWVWDLKYDRLNYDRSIWVIEDIERRRDQNISNALHATTLLRLLYTAGIKPREMRYLPMHDPGKPSYAKGAGVVSEKMQTVLLNMARCEHERWVAASKLQGLRLADRKDIRLKHHTDLVPWEVLRNGNTKERQEVQSYDLNVVDMSIAIDKYAILQNATLPSDVTSQSFKITPGRIEIADEVYSIVKLAKYWER